MFDSRPRCRKSEGMRRLEGVAPPAERVSCSLEGELDDEGDTWGATVLRLCVVVPLPCTSEADLLLLHVVVNISQDGRKFRNVGLSSGLK